MTRDSQSGMQDQHKASSSRGPLFEQDSSGLCAPVHPKVKLIAFYLPQFHAIPQNNQWWGNGFTEWTNVTKALPRFVGHIQPHLPADLGFYDLANSDTMRDQIQLARRYGIAGFCFHHYWFNGRRLLEKPLDFLLGDPTLDMPFCVNWANENWTRRWDGQDQDILMAQEYSPEDDVAFARHLIQIVRDKRYIYIDGRPLIMVYRPGLLPNSFATMRRWRAEFTASGLANPYIVMAQGFGDDDPRLHGVDGAAEFPPHKVGITLPINADLQLFDPAFAGHVLDYNDVAQYATSLPAPPFKLFRGVCPSWDNEARKPGRGFALAFSTPTAYGNWLRSACQDTIAEAGSDDERIVFINAWNEWAEGAYLEPDRHFGYAYLAETGRVLASLDNPPGKTAITAPGRLRLALISHDAHFHGAQVVALAIAKTLVEDHKVSLRILIGGPGELTEKFREIAPTETIPGNFDDVAVWQKSARRLVESGVTAVLVNTLVSARAIRPLRDAGLRIIQLVHELPSLIKQYGLESASRDAAAYAAAIVFPSTYVRNCFEEIAGSIRGKSVVRHQGLHMRPLPATERTARRVMTRRELGVDEHQPMILGIGYGDVRKGLDLWPALIRRVLKDCPRAVFVWVGNINPALRNWLEHDLRQIGLEKNLILCPATNDLSGIYAAADAYVLTSREDPFPSVVVEAMASGLPTIVFEKSGGIVDLVRDAGGITVAYCDIDAMADAIVGIVGDPIAAKAMGTTLATRIAEDFDYADYGADLIALARGPFVSVVVPNFNYGRHLRQRVESIWIQTVPVGEIIILDDGSTDNSKAVIEELVLESPIPIRVLWNDMNSGSVSRQWARGVALARGDFVWIAEADDFTDSEFLEAVIPAFEDLEVVLSYSESRMVGEKGQVLAPDYLGYVADIDATRWKTDYKASGPEEVARAFAVKNTIPNVSAAVFRREALAEVLANHLEAMSACQNAADWLCYIRLLQFGGAIAFTARPLNNHRRHNKGVTISTSDKRHYDEIVAMQDLVAAEANVVSETRSKAIRYRNIIAQNFGLGMRDPVLTKIADDDWLELLRRSASGELIEINGRPLPSMPDKSVQTNTVGQAGAGAIEEAWTYASLCLTRFRTSPNFADSEKVLLDFGTGWARIARCFLRDFSPEYIIGVDVDSDLIGLCQSTFPGPNFITCNSMPPLMLGDATIDFVVGYSVFSHLSEEACRSWMAEFSRVLKPGGMVALTTRGRWFFDYAESLAGTDSYSNSLSKMFPDFADARARYDRGEFVHSNAAGVAGGGALNGGFYGETFIPERFARESISGTLNLIEFYEGDSHPIMFFEKQAK